MIQWIDSHCHLNYPELCTDLTKTLQNAKESNVQGMLSICTDLQDFEHIYAMAEQYPHIWASVGVHPHEAEAHSSAYNTPQDVYSALCAKCELPKVVGLGETGLDYYYEHSPKTQQQDFFKVHCDVAIKNSLPLIVHTRDAEEDTLHILKSYQGKLTGVIHCFTGTEYLAKRALDLGFYISISGVITFKKADQLRSVMQYIPLDRMLIETDAPYLAPEPYRGQANQPAYITKTAEKIASVLQIDLQKLSEHTTNNFFNLFHKAQVS